MLDTFPIKCSEPAVVLIPVKFVGGAAAVTKVNGRDCTIAYVSTGVVTLTFGEGHGSFLGMLGRSFEATTQADVDGWTAVPGVYNATTRVLTVKIYNDTPALADLAALNWLTMVLAFQQVGSGV